MTRKMRALIGLIIVPFFIKAQEVPVEKPQPTKAENYTFLAKNKLKPGVVTLPSGLQYRIVKQGSGPKAGPEGKVQVNYVAMMVNGKEFERSQRLMEMYTVKDQVLKAWAGAMPLMSAGSRWLIYAPSEMAFGQKTLGGRIPAHSNLIFDLEMVSVLKPTAAATEASAFLNKNKLKPGVRTTKSGLQYKVLVPGKGANACATDKVLLRYRLSLITGKKIGRADSLMKEQFLDNEMPAILEAVTMMNPGSKWKLFIPYRLGPVYGLEGLEDGALLICDIELVKTTRDLQREKPNATGTENLAFLKENKLKAGVVELTSGLQYKVLTMGTGEKPGAADTVEVHYTGMQVNGKIFDSSVAKGTPLKINVSDVIKGWTEALQLMPAGSKWILYIPSAMAYGEEGSTGIPPGSNLIFEVEVLKVIKNASNKDPEMKTTSSGLQYKVVKSGDGAKPLATDGVKLYYNLTLADGKQLWKGFDSNNPWIHRMDKALPGMQEALVMMPVGSRWTLYIPAELAFGKEGYEEVPPGAVVVCDLELVEIVK